MRAAALVLGAVAVACAQLEDGGGPSAAAGCRPNAEPSQRGHSEITSACIDGAVLRVQFAVFVDGVAVNDLASSEVGLTVARLVGEPSRWSSYIARVEGPGIGDWPGTEPLLQATTDTGGLLESRGRGLYRYSFAARPTYDAFATHRVSLELRGDGRELPADNPTFDFVPAGRPIRTRAIADTASCNECHGRLAVHGGARTELDACVTCHNPGTADAQSGNNLDLALLVHKLHRGRNLPSVVAGGQYAVWGFRNIEHDYSQLRYPQDIRNCAKCHSSADASTPDGDRWLTTPSAEACGSCHDDISFGLPLPPGLVLHTGGPQGNDSCAGCHGPVLVAANHATSYSTPNNPLLPEGVPVLAFELTAVSGLTPGAALAVSFRVLADGAPVDLQAPPTGLAPSLRLMLGWSAPEGAVAAPDDYNNSGASDTEPGQPRRVALDSELLAVLVANPDGSFTAPAGALGSIPPDAVRIVVALEGTVTVAGRRLGAQSVMVDEPPRRRVVELARCNACHERLSVHGDNRVDNVDYCAVCHNPNATDIEARPATLDVDGDGMLDDPDALGVDGLREQAIDLRELIHKLHAGGALSAERYVVYGFGRAVNDFRAVRFPRPLRDCLACHLEGTFELPLVNGALATTKLTGSVPTDDTAGGFLATPADDLDASPTGAACAGCHDSAPAQAHAQTSAPWWEVAIDGIETDGCAACHGPGRLADVRRVHRLAETGD